MTDGTSKLAFTRNGSKADLYVFGEFDAVLENIYGDRLKNYFFDAMTTGKSIVDDASSKNPLAEITMHIMSPGGNVAEGDFLRVALVSHPGKKTARIYGLTASMATAVAMSADEIQISSLGQFLAHEASTCSCGKAEDLRNGADLLDSLNAALANLYAKKTGKTQKEMLALMAKDKFISAEKALEIGLVDKIISDDKPAISASNSTQNNNTMNFKEAIQDLVAKVKGISEAVDAAAGKPTVPVAAENSAIANAADLAALPGKNAPVLDITALKAQMRAEFELEAAQKAVSELAAKAKSDKTAAFDAFLKANEKKLTPALSETMKKSADVVIASGNDEALAAFRTGIEALREHGLDKPFATAANAGRETADTPEARSKAVDERFERNAEELLNKKK